MLNQVETMKNKNLQQVQLELIENLLGEVNSKEEFDYLIKEKVNLLSLISHRIERRYA